MHLTHFVLFSLLLSVTLSSGLQERSFNKFLVQNRTASADDDLRRQSPDSKWYDQNSPTQKCATDYECPFWTSCNHVTRECKCRQEYIDLFDGIVQCRDGKLSVLDCYCVTYDNSTGQESIIAGSCLVNCMRATQTTYDDRYLLLPVNLDEINTKMCINTSNRGGQLCGQCLDGYRPLSYSFNITCVNCTEGTSNLFIYFTLVFLPMTAFYFIVLFFKVNVTSSYLHGFVLFSQAVSISAFCRVITMTIEKLVSVHEYSLLASISIKILISLYGIWSLDLFQMTYPEVCLDMSPLSVRALDYIIALYPFFLTILSYVLIELHDRNLRPLVIIWKPFRCLFAIFRRQWNIRTSVIDAYATFYLLSLFKILSITVDMLVPVPAYDLKVPNGTKYTYVLYYDGNIEYFGKEHLPYAVPAIIIAVLFVVFPTTLLLLYPSRCFQYLLNHTKFPWYILHTFMDSFHGCYKDGTELGTRDCRYFAGVYILLRIVLFIIYSFTLNSMTFPLTVFVTVTFVIVLINAQPHKEAFSHHNKINATFLCILVLYFVGNSTVDISSLKAHRFERGCFILTVLVGRTPLIYISWIFIHWAITHRKWGKEFMNRVRAWRRGYEPMDDDHDSLPHRVSNPDDYQIMNYAVDLEPETGPGIGVAYTE